MAYEVWQLGLTYYHSHGWCNIFSDVAQNHKSTRIANDSITARPIHLYENVHVIIICNYPTCIQKQNMSFAPVQLN